MKKIWIITRHDVLAKETLFAGAAEDEATAIVETQKMVSKEPSYCNGEWSWCCAHPGEYHQWTCGNVYFEAISESVLCSPRTGFVGEEAVIVSGPVFRGC
jgi:hypothetical protein